MIVSELAEAGDTSEDHREGNVSLTYDSHHPLSECRIAFTIIGGSLPI